MWDNITTEDILSEPNLHDFLSSSGIEFDTSIVTDSDVRDLAGIRVAALSELVVIAKKNITAYQSTKLLYEQGYCSWSSVDAYHTSILTAKTILATFGIFMVRINEFSVLIDVFPQYAPPKKKKHEKKSIQNASEPVRFIVNNKKIEHRHVWELMSRMFKVCNLEKVPESYERWGKHFKFDKYRPTRNKIIYNSAYWTKLLDLPDPTDEIETIKQRELFHTFIENLWIHDDLCDHFLMEIFNDFNDKLLPSAVRSYMSKDALKVEA